MRFNDIVTKKLVERKIKLFVVLIFHSPYGRNTNYWTNIAWKFIPFGKDCLNEINNIFFDDLKKIDLQTTLTMSFTTFLESISIDNEYIDKCIKSEN